MILLKGQPVVQRVGQSNADVRMLPNPLGRFRRLKCQNVYSIGAKGIRVGLGAGAAVHDNAFGIRLIAVLVRKLAAQFVRGL